MNTQPPIKLNTRLWGGTWDTFLINVLCKCACHKGLKVYHTVPHSCHPL